MTLLALLASVALLLVPAPAPAAAAATAPRTRVAVLDVRATGGLEASSVEGLAGLLASGMTRQDVQVVSPTDIRAMIGFERQRELLGCTDVACLAEIGGALGADYLVVSELSRFGESYLLSLSLVPMRAGRQGHRLTRRAATQEQVLDGAAEGTAELLTHLPGPAAAVPVPLAEAAEPAPPGATAPAPAPEQDEEGRSTLAWALLGVGSVAAVTGGVLYARGYSLDGEPMLALDAEEEQGRVVLGLGLLGGGVALAVGALLIDEVWP